MKSAFAFGGLFALFLFASLSADAQTVQVVPAHPTYADTVLLRIFPGAAYLGGAVTRTGNHFRVDLSICPILCHPTLDIVLGTLEPGAYTYEVFRPDNTLLASGSFAVAGPEIPTLSEYALLALALLLGGAGWLFVGRRT